MSTNKNFVLTKKESKVCFCNSNDILDQMKPTWAMYKFYRVDRDIVWGPSI